ncbi:GNAT family N-acetyltransferase [Pseudalkalibacillus caeni]|uniref:GNAT family N-acetyltransferase n=1 Tax=Exobacillus caeni TaxID=2574798 RepID=A0A5R9F232_9BACL|nr:GNAT family N-acetyltransferase [Pseudalkalibacillus caeni]TLS36589.1 GNAT family N-acetyltransferase [Pseudalkalibacillus caeni]
MEYKHYIQELPPASELDQIFRLNQEIFGNLNKESILSSLKKKENASIFLAIDESVIAYKIGYERKSGHYYSWLGGVSPAYREKGIASTLMKKQHDWCLQTGYQSIQTKTKNKWKGMLILNLKYGFDIIGTYTDEKGEPKIILQKILREKL